ncbi:MAG: GDSL-type esterase/lipase family protein [Campylobacteraceae bacterium]
MNFLKKATLTFVASTVLLGGMLFADANDNSKKWATSWTGSVQGPYPVGNPSAQPNMTFVFPAGQNGAKDQSFRMIVKPNIWGEKARVRLTNALGAKAVTFADVYAGLQLGSSGVVKGTNSPVTFNGKNSVTVEPGEFVWSDPIELKFVKELKEEFLYGRNLAVSYHIVGESGPMTWHAKAIVTSYATAPNTKSKGADVSEDAFPFATASWFFLDAVDMFVDKDTKVIVAFGDSITDGTASTINGYDRWPDVLSRRANAIYGNKVSVVNAGIGGNQIAGPAEYSAQKPFPGGPSASTRYVRDVLGLSGVSTLIWFEGINDFSKNGNASVAKVIDAMTKTIKDIRAKNPNIKIFGATVVSAFNAPSKHHGSQEQDDKRKEFNEFIRTSKLFDGFIDFDKVITDETSGEMRAEFIPDNTVGSAGDKIHPNRLGYLKMGMSIDIKSLLK